MDIDELKSLIALAEHGSFAAAARALGVPRTTLRRRLDALEARVSLPLLLRSSRTPTLTAAGRELVSRGQGLVRQSDTLVAELLAHSRDPESRVEWLLPYTVHPVAVAMVTGQTARLFPNIRPDVRFVPDAVEAMRTSGDLAMHLGERVPEGPWYARRVGTMSLRLLAHVDYAEAMGIPQTLEDLDDHVVYTWLQEDQPMDTLPLLDGSRHALTSRIACNDFQAGDDAARLGLGIGLAPTQLAPGTWDPEVRVLVLVDVVGLDLPVWLVSSDRLSHRPGLQPYVDATVAFLEAAGGL